MLFGEMTITLDDVSALLAIPVVGKTVSRSLPDDAETVLSYTLGVTTMEACKELRSSHSCSVKLEWLSLRFKGVTDGSDPKVIRCSVRAYLLYLLRCTLLTDKTGTRLPVDYLHCLEDFDSIHTYAWGITMLAYLY